MHEKYIDQLRKKRDKHWFLYSIRLDFGKDFLPPPALEQYAFTGRSDVSSGLTALKHN